MERERFVEIMDGESNLSGYEQDNALLGLKVISSYLPKRGIEGADHDIIYSVYVDELLDAGLQESDAILLCSLNWMIRDECLACFV